MFIYGNNCFFSFCFTTLSFDPVTKVVRVYPSVVTYSSPQNCWLEKKNIDIFYYFQKKVLNRNYYRLHDWQVITNDCNAKQLMGYHLKPSTAPTAIILLPFSWPAKSVLFACLSIHPSSHFPIFSLCSTWAELWSVVFPDTLWLIGLSS